MLTRHATANPTPTQDSNSLSPMRSATPNPSTPTKLRDRIPLPHKLVKSNSSTDIATQSSMAAAAVATPRTFSSTFRGRGLMGDPDHVMDTRTPSPVQRGASVDSDGADYKPDLSQEVAMLSTKLVNAINYQTTLDDNLQHTRHELESEKTKGARLAAEKKSLDDMIAQGLLVRKSEVDKQISMMRAELEQERVARQEAEKSKKQVEGELENLTSALFEEANTMVAAARRDTEAAEKRNGQLRSQLGDTELLLQSQQEQLRDLKGTMERLSERGDAETLGVRDSSAPSTPIDRTHAGFDQLSPDNTGVSDFNPEHPLYFSQLLQPVMRNDIQAYADFQELLAAARRAAPHSRTGSGAHQPFSSSAASGSQTNLPGAFSGSPSLPGAFSFSNSSPTSGQYANLPPLKESKFYKRILSEDVEPCLRLDLAPGLSFLSRRSVLSSILGGTLVVEPFTPQHRFYGPVFACALCGENRKQEPYVRKHRFRTSESDDAQRYPLCDYCLARVRSVGDFVGFLRMVRDGHWRCEKEEDEKGAWEESVRLRERMFWARLGGGVIPAVSHQHSPGNPGLERQSSTKAIKSARQSLESVPEETRGRQRLARNITPGDQEIKTSQQDVGAPDTEVEDGAVRQLLMSSSSIAAAPSGRGRELSVSRPVEQNSSSPSTADVQEDAGNATATELASSQEDAVEADHQLRLEASGQQTLQVDDLATDEFSTPATEKPEPDMTQPGTDDALPQAETVEAPKPGLDRTMTNESIGASSVKSASSEVTSDGRKGSLKPGSEGHDRRPSAVLARVRAMEARASSGS
ncbi:Sec2p-domain-containing protein [Polychaeton citri CBS 116435]|uniref:Sec2p-domain-containing protein n=1 Tax=Polychaeton citri CBS 116435 TaxID=1314669 RepID=A0A9P4QHA5_9PEZI|nr:Sec2p-domain-containing protein [Polychaeton citri CBS 116435]